MATASQTIAGATDLLRRVDLDVDQSTYSFNKSADPGCEWTTSGGVRRRFAVEFNPQGMGIPDGSTITSLTLRFENVNNTDASAVSIRLLPSAVSAYIVAQTLWNDCASGTLDSSPQLFRNAGANVAALTNTALLAFQSAFDARLTWWSLGFKFGFESGVIDGFTGRTQGVTLVAVYDAPAIVVPLNPYAWIRRRRR